MARHLSGWDATRGRTFNARGGCAISASLLETTQAREEITGRRLQFASVPETHRSDVRIYLTDNSLPRSERSDWSERMSVVIVTGSARLVGSEAVRFYAYRGMDVFRIDNDMRAYYFSAEASTKWQRDQRVG